MKKRITIFIFNIIWALSIFGCQSEPEYVELNPGFAKELTQKVYGKVKSMTYHTYRPILENDKVLKGKLSNDLNVIYGYGIRADFDSKGRITNYHYLNRMDTTSRSMNKWKYVNKNEIWFMALTITWK